MEMEVGAEAEELVNYLNTIYLQRGLRPQLLPHADHIFNYTERLRRFVTISVGLPAKVSYFLSDFNRNRNVQETLVRISIICSLTLCSPNDSCEL